LSRQATSPSEHPLSANTIPQISFFSLPFLPFVLEPFFEMRLVLRNRIAPLVAKFPPGFDMPFKRQAVTGVKLDEERAAVL
jgi:hypothetical protein